MVEREHKRVKVIRKSVRRQSPSMDARSVLGAKFLVGGQDGVDICTFNYVRGIPNPMVHSAIKG